MTVWRAAVKVWRAVFPEQLVDLRAVYEVLDLEIREQRRLDDYRIHTRQDVNVEALRRRMVEGKSPRVTVLQQVAPVWARRA